MTTTNHHDAHSADHLTDTDFAAELERLVARARDAGVGLEGAYDVRTPRGGQSDYTIEISAVVKRSDIVG